MPKERRYVNKEFMQVLNEVSMSHAACSARVTEQIKALSDKIDGQHEEIKNIVSRQNTLNGQHHQLDLKITKLTAIAGFIGGLISLVGRYIFDRMFQ